jgi:hypothetical protein
MIVFDLCCAQGGHVFEVWFANSAAYNDQRARGLLLCPVCGDVDISKAVMAPSVPAKSNSRGSTNVPEASSRAVMANPAKADASAEIRGMLAKIAALQSEALKSSQWVGKDFEQKARAMDAGEIDAGPIHGQATPEQAKSMIDDGIGVLPLLIPIVPPDELN